MVILFLVACGWSPLTTGPVGGSSDGDSGAGAGDTASDSGSPGEGTAPSPMSAERALVRLSLDLRGVRPSEAELAAVAADPAAVDAYLDAFLEDPRFEEQVVSMYKEVWLTVTDWYQVDAGQLDVESEPELLASVGQEPLRILARIAAEDRPYYEVVTADWTVVNEVLAGIYSTDYAGSGWQVAHYTDGRPAAGVIATNGLWWRYGSTRSNAHRARANVISKALLCNDYLSRPIAFDRSIDLTDSDAVDDAVQNNPACVGCHVSLDPLASHLWGFWWYVEDSAVDRIDYHPERERLWEDYSGVAPAYYGSPSSSLATLPDHIAADPRLPECAVEQAFELFLRRETTLDDIDRLVAHREAFLDGGLTLKALYRSVLHDPDYLAAEQTRDGAVPAKMVSADVLASSVEGLTGYRWSWHDYDMLLTDENGVRTLAGGADGYTVTRSSNVPNATLLLVQQRLAELAAAWAVQEERRLDRSARTLFTEVDLTERPGQDDAAVRAQLEKLVRRVLSRAPADDAEIDGLYVLWADVYASTNQPGEAWEATLSALLRDPDFLIY